MLSPEEAKRLVKNRIARKAREAERAEETKLDYIEQAVAIYISQTDFIDYVTETIDEAFVEAKSEDWPFFVGFSTRDTGDDDQIVRNADIRDRFANRIAGKCCLCYFQTAACGIDAPLEELAVVFCETIASLYHENGWWTSELDRYSCSDKNLIWSEIFELAY